MSTESVAFLRSIVVMRLSSSFRAKIDDNNSRSRNSQNEKVFFAGKFYQI